MLIDNMKSKIRYNKGINEEVILRKIFPNSVWMINRDSGFIGL